jgi:AcrR family transcriptional regulator
VPPKTQKKRPGRRRDAEVLDAALKVFYEQGYSGATVQDIADELGILKGSLYHYIDTKEDLLFGLIESVHQAAVGMHDEIMEVEGLAPLDRVRLYVERQVEFNLDHLQLVAVYYQDMERLSEERRALVKARQRENSRFMVGLIKEAQARGEADPERDASLLANLVFATIVWTYRWYRPGGRASRKTVARTCGSYAIDGLVGPTVK